MRKEIYAVNETKGGEWSVIYIEYGKGINIALEDVLSIFGEDKGFRSALEKELEDNAPAYVEDEGEQVQVITLPTLIEAVYHAEDLLERLTLYNFLMEVEKTLVNVWG